MFGEKKINQIQWRLDSMSSSPWFQQEHPGAGEISHFLRTAAPFWSCFLLESICVFLPSLVFVQSTPGWQIAFTATWTGNAQPLSLHDTHKYSECVGNSGNLHSSFKLCPSVKQILQTKNQNQQPSLISSSQAGFANIWKATSCWLTEVLILSNDYASTADRRSLQVWALKLKKLKRSQAHMIVFALCPTYHRHFSWTWPQQLGMMQNYSDLYLPVGTSQQGWRWF